MAEVRLVAVSGPSEGKEFELSGAATVGRDQSAGIVIDDAEASRRHASVSVEGLAVTVEDLGSTNGTFVNGQRISAAQTLSQGDKLRIGTTVFEVQVAADDEVQATRVGTALPDLDDIQVTAPRQVPDFAKDPPPEDVIISDRGPLLPNPPVAPDAAPPEPPPFAAPAPLAATNAPPPSSTPPPSFAPPPPAAADPFAGPPPSAAAPPGAGAPPPAPAFGGPPPPPYGSQPAPYGGGGPPAAPGSGYPAQLEIDYPQNGIARWRVFFQGWLAIPHFFALFFVAFAAYFAFVGVWFSIVFTKKYPPGLFNFITGVLRWSSRVSGYVYLMTEQYPPFSTADEPYPIRARFQYPQNGIARWRPFFQGLLAFPHFVVLYFLAIGAGLAFVFAWFVILFTGKYPPGVFNFIAGVMRWQTRVSAYMMLMTEEYPPFELA